MHLLSKTTITATTLLVLTSCASATQSPASPETPGIPHGYVEGAVEGAEPQLHIATIDAGGNVALLDLLSEQSSKLTTLDGTTELHTDGRYLFASTESGLHIVDTGVWTVDHEDHSHYYRADPRDVGTIDQLGPATVSGGTTLTGVWFQDAGTGVVLDSEALGTGSIEELATIAGEPHPGFVVPFADGLLVTESDDGLASGVRAYNADGDALESMANCPDLSGTIGTRVGQVFGCSDGAVLATIDANGNPQFESIPYPAGTAPADRALDFRSRPGRPTVAAVAGTTGAWLLDTRNRTWTLLSTEAPLLLVAAVDDREGHVVALANDGRVLVIDPSSGATLAATSPILAASVADAALLAGLELTVDSSRAYINAPAEGVVYEIDYADQARIARTFEVPGSPLFFAETGR